MSGNAASPMVSSTAVMLAADRLNASRLHLRQALMPPPHTHDTGGRSSRPFLGRWMDRLAGVPAASVLIDTVQRWWGKHPLRLAWLLADDAAQTLLQPVARKHPYRLVLGAAAAGALLALSRPWRSALMAGLLPPLINQAVSRSSGNALDPHNQ